MAAIEPKMVTLKNGQPVCIRNRMSEDWPEISNYIETVFADNRFFMTTLQELRPRITREKNDELVRSCQDHAQKLLLVAELDGRLLSISKVECGTRLRNQHIGQIGISIVSDFRGLGLGTAIMQTMIDWAQGNPLMEKLALGVWSQNTPAIRLYEKMGSIEEGRKVQEVKYADGTYDDCICMYRMVNGKR